jgi:hypothetical protein
MKPEPIFNEISSRLSFFFPEGAFVYINLTDTDSGLLRFQHRSKLQAMLVKSKMSLAFPPDVEGDILNMTQSDEAYWEYHFPGLRHLHHRKQGIIIQELLRGIDVKVAGQLILRKLNLPVLQRHYLLFFSKGQTWCCDAPQFQSEEAMVQLMVEIAGTGFNHWKYPYGDRHTANYSRGHQTDLLREHGSLPNMLLNAFRDDFSRFQDGEAEADTDVDAQAMLSDPEVLRVLEMIRQTETERGFYKIIRGLLTELVMQQSPDAAQLAPDMSRMIASGMHHRMRMAVNVYENTLYFWEVDIAVPLQPLDFAVYRLFLNHPEGIIMRERQAYLDEMRGLYRAVRSFEDEARMEEILRPMFVLSEDSGSMMQCISRIKARFRSRMDEVHMMPYIIHGKRNQPYRIACDRTLVR